MATTQILLASAASMAVVVPLVQASKPSWLDRLFRRKKAEPAAVVAEPPRIVNDAGWQLIHSEDAESFREWLHFDSEGMPVTAGEIPSLGSHVLIELFGCNKEALELERSVGTAMRDAAFESKATVVAESFHEFKPWGVSGAVIIQESHYTIHTWPEHGYAAVDLFYCGGTVHVDKAVDVLRARFQPSKIKFLVVRRGIQNEVEG